MESACLSEAMTSSEVRPWSLASFLLHAWIRFKRPGLTFLIFSSKYRSFSSNLVASRCLEKGISSPRCVFKYRDNCAIKADTASLHGSHFIGFGQKPKAQKSCSQSCYGKNVMNELRNFIPDKLQEETQGLVVLINFIDVF